VPLLEHVPTLSALSTPECKSRLWIVERYSCTDVLSGCKQVSLVGHCSLRDWPSSRATRWKHGCLRFRALLLAHVKYDPCHQAMARRQVADGDGLQIWMLAANILNKQSRTAGKGWSCSLRVGHGTGNFSLKKKNKKTSFLRNVTKGHRPGRILCINDLR
jgi:hypothetical protein